MKLDLDTTQYYEVSITLRYSQDGHSREFIHIDKIYGLSLWSLLTFGIPFEEITDLWYKQIT
jgi:hypothetical protein